MRRLILPRLPCVGTDLEVPMAEEATEAVVAAVTIAVGTIVDARPVIAVGMEVGLTVNGLLLVILRAIGMLRLPEEMMDSPHEAVQGMNMPRPGDRARDTKIVLPGEPPWKLLLREETVNERTTGAIGENFI
jgi:hypothetical protein